MPFWALLVSVGVFAVPAVLTGLHPAPSAVVGLSWLFVATPVFFFGYYEAWRGVALALAVWFSMLALSVMAGLLLSTPAPDWTFLGLLSVSLVVLSLAVGWLSASLRRELSVAVDRERTMVEQLALRDQLTTLPNSKYVKLYLENAFAGAQRGYPLCIVVFDVDHLRDYNAYHGQDAGDAALRAIGHVLRRTTRKMEISARLDGDRFVTLLTTRDPASAVKFVRRVRQGLLEMELPRGRVTLSAGIAAYDPAMSSSQDLLGAAEGALDRAQEKGSEREAVFSPNEKNSAAAPVRT